MTRPAPHPSRRPLRHTGVGAVELVTLLVSVAVAAGLTLPKLAGHPAAAAEAAASSLAADLSYAHRLAAETGRPHYVVFDPAASSYAVYVDRPAGTPVPNLTTGRAFAVWVGTDQTAGAALVGVDLGGRAGTVLSFDPSGPVAAGPAGGPMLPLPSAARVTVAAGFYRWTVTVDPDTGDVGFEP